jgi:hypothetical protein
MEQPKKFNIDPITLEAEFKVMSIRRRLHELSREELEEFLSECLMLLTHLTNQTKQFRKYIEGEEGKT